MYSDMSIRIIASSVSNMNSLSALQSSVFPTPVGPKKIREAMGLVGSLSPARERCTASVTTSTASLCPITRSLNLSPIDKMRARSLSRSFVGGIPVQTATTSAMSSAITSSRSMRSSSSPAPFSSATCSSVTSSSWRGGSLAYLSSAALLRSNSRSHFSISSMTLAISVLTSLMRSTPPFSAIHFKFSACCSFLRSIKSLSITARRLPASLFASWFSSPDS
mmetsp:Transcript_109437/g.223649  ORF Transcript_109437/g.223649 Transcript_109437/m.223649 type:complete len:221 (+) Transcript_109437:1427-2089(+)